MDFKQQYDQYRARVERSLKCLLPGTGDLLDSHYESMRYSINAGGKRVRPILCIAAADAVGECDDRILPVACALECIHTYSLIHDDLPAMDNDDLRRGKPTNHKVFGEAEAILAGDGLLTFAFELLSGNDFSGAVEARDQVRIINTIAQAAGPAGMVGGQAIDIASEGKDVSFDTLCFIHSHKTGALIRASVQTGAIFGGATDEQFNALTLYGENAGLAFQIVDDLLDVTGTTEQLGKSAGSDAELKKATYPAFFGVEETKRKARLAVDNAISALAIFNEKANFLRNLAEYIFSRTK